MIKATALLSILTISLTTLAAKTVYVAKDGNDSNPGTFEEPYGSIAKASSVLFAGDTVYIRGGEYRATIQLPRSGTTGNPIVILGYPGEKVVISAMEPLSGWELDEGNVYKTAVNWNLGQRNLVMIGDTACDLARWPNNDDGDPFTLNALRNSGGSTGTVINGAYLDYNPGIPDHDWGNGGSIFFYCDKAGWIAWKAFITSSTTNRLVFNLNKNPDWIRTQHPPADLGYFYLEGIREALDHQKEWFFNENTKMLYIQLPGGIMPADSTVYMRKRINTIKLNQNYVVVKNLEVIGGSIEITGSHNHIYGIKSHWGNHHRGIMTGFSAGSQSVWVSGSYNIVEKCDIGYGTATGVRIQGSYNKVSNNLIHHFNTLGSYDAPVIARSGNTAATISRNTIFNGGRDCVQISIRNSVLSYNDISRSNLIADDCGLYYVTNGPHNIHIHHNWFHDTYSKFNNYKAAGIYLDNDAAGFTVHHNVVWNTEWTSIQMNKDIRDINIYNNTFWDGSAAMGAWHAEGTHFERVVIYNNLSNKGGWEPQADKQNNLTISSDPFVNRDARDWQLKPGTQPVDFGRIISGYADEFSGEGPDIGAYEFGGPMWKAGIDWDPELGPDACLEADVYEEVDGIAIIEAESASSLGEGWEISSQIPSLGDLYLEYTGADNDSMVVDSTVSTYQVKISNPGTYRFEWLSRNGPDAPDVDQDNSSWVNIECDKFFGSVDGNELIIDTAFAAFSVQDTSNWTWQSESQIEGTGNIELYATFNYSGIYAIRIAGKASGHLIDRMVLYQEGRESLARDTTRSESWTGCDEYTLPNPWSAPSLAKLYYYQDDFTIDGIVDGEWDNLPVVSVDHSLASGGMPVDEDLSCSFKLSFNDNALFLLATIQDDVLSNETIDLFLNPDNGHQTLGIYGKDAIHLKLYYGLEDSIRIMNGSWKSSDFSGFSSFTRDIEGGYILEARIPWSGIHPIGFENSTTTYMGFELQVNDVDTGPDIKNRIAWANTTGIDIAGFDTRKFGSISLLKDLELVPVRVEGVDIFPDTLFLDPGELVVMEAEVLPDSADNKSITWLIDDPWIAYLAPSTGHIRGRNPGTTMVTATTQEGGFTDSIVVIVIDPYATTSIEDLNLTDPEKREISLVPNPASASFWVKGSDRWSQLKVYNSNGELVLHLGQGEFREYIQIDQLPAGLYLVRILEGENVYLRKLIKE